MTDATHYLEADTVYEFSGVVGIQNQSSSPIVYTLGTTFSDTKKGIILKGEDSFTSSTVFVKSDHDCRIMILTEV